MNTTRENGAFSSPAGDVATDGPNPALFFRTTARGSQSSRAWACLCALYINTTYAWLCLPQRPHWRWVGCHFLLCTSYEKASMCQCFIIPTEHATEVLSSCKYGTPCRISIKRMHRGVSSIFSRVALEQTRASLAFVFVQ
jgi:hypothetical protein